MTCCCVLDFNTIAAADKFGNVSIVSDQCLAVYCHLYIHGRTCMNVVGGGGSSCDSVNG